MTQVFQKETWPNLYKNSGMDLAKFQNKKREKNVMSTDLILIIAQPENVNQAHPEIYLICPTLLLHRVT